MTCAITGVFRTPNGVVLPEGTVVEFSRSAKTHTLVADTGPTVIIPNKVSMVIGAGGVGSINLYPGRYQVTIAGGGHTFLVAVPDEVSISFVALLTQAPEYNFDGEIDQFMLYASQAQDAKVEAEAAAVAAGASATVALGSETAAVAAQGLAIGAQVAAESARDTAQGAATTATTKAGEAAADRVQTGLDRVQTTADALATAADRVQTGVDAATAAAAALAVAGQDIAAFGLGVTGSNVLIADIDSLVIPSGIYRYNSTTVGTFPTGITASATGQLRVDRQSATSAVETLFATSNRMFVRFMNSSVKGEWRDVHTPTQSAATGSIARKVAGGGWSSLGLGASDWVLGSNGSDLAYLPPPIGVGQTWQDVSGSRVNGTSYQNTTGRPITVAECNAVTGYTEVSVDGVTWIKVGVDSASYSFPNQFIVPNNWYYRVSNAGGTRFFWSELR